MKPWVTVNDIQENQLACPYSIGNTEAGRYTFCLANRCMAWKWHPDQIKEAENNIMIVSPDEIPEGWHPISSPYSSDDDVVVDVIKLPTHGRCGMVP